MGILRVVLLLFATTTTRQENGLNNSLWIVRLSSGKAFVRSGYFSRLSQIRPLLKPYLPPRDRKLRLPDIYEMFEQMKDHA
jgi:hypothetical protein